MSPHHHDISIPAGTINFMAQDTSVPSDWTIYEPLQARVGAAVPIIKTTDRTTYDHAGEETMAMPLAPGQTNLYEVIVVDKTIKNDADAIEFYYVRAATADEAKMRALLRESISETVIGDYEFVVRALGPVSAVVEDKDAE